MKKLLIALMLVLASNQALAGVKGSVGYEKGKAVTTTEIPYTVCTPVCQTVTNTYKTERDTSGIRLNLGYEQHIAGPVSIDLMAGTTPSFFDLRLESNLIYSVNDNLSIKGGVNRYQEKSDANFKYHPGMGFQAGVEYKLPSAGEVTPFVDVKYYRMNSSYDFQNYPNKNDVKYDSVSVGIGLSF